MLGMPLSRPMPEIGYGCHELRINDERTTHRIFYAVRPDAVVILGIETKKTKATPQGVIRTCTARLKRFEEV